jgi:DnaJ-class molecular chaperone
MIRYPSPTYLRYPFPPRKAAKAELCPKCHGLGKLVLMRRMLAADVVDVCPTCEGHGLVVKQEAEAKRSKATYS